MRISFRCVYVICSCSANYARALPFSDSFKRRYICSRTWPSMGDWCTNLTAWCISGESSSSVKVWSMWLSVAEGYRSIGYSPLTLPLFIFLRCFLSLFFLCLCAFIIDCCMSSIIWLELLSSLTDSISDVFVLMTRLISGGSCMATIVRSSWSPRIDDS